MWPECGRGRDRRSSKVVVVVENLLQRKRRRVGCPPFHPCRIHSLTKVCACIGLWYGSDKAQLTPYELHRRIGNSVFTFFRNQETQVRMMCNCSEWIGESESIGDQALVLEPTLHRIGFFLGRGRGGREWPCIEYEYNNMYKSKKAPPTFSHFQLPGLSVLALCR